ncbi:MAG: fibronectin type III domain-containing protein [Clostridia bacterium]|nr:fibronectin type III domain-containing protein [Clostridiales bacterium]
MNWIKSVAVGALLILSVLLSFTLVLAKENPPPGAPRDLVVTNVGKTNAQLKWTSPEDTDVYCYKVYKDGIYLSDTIGPTTVYNIIGLSPGATYTFKVSAFDGHNEGPFSNEITVTTETEESKRGNATGSITYPEDGQRLNALGSITGTASDSDGTVISVGLYITNDEGHYLKQDMSAFQPGEGSVDYLIPVRNTGTNYSTWELGIDDFSVFKDGEYLMRVCPDDGLRCMADQACFTVDTTPPLPPEGLLAERITSTVVKLVWAPSVSGDTVGYYVYRDGEHFASTTSTWLNVDSLTPDTCYSFCVAAHDGLNTGDPGDALQVTMLPEPGDPNEEPPEDPPDKPPVPPEGPPEGPPSTPKRRRSSQSGEETPLEYPQVGYTCPIIGGTLTEAIVHIGQTACTIQSCFFFAPLLRSVIG